jgi:hypothetical protein
MIEKCCVYTMQGTVDEIEKLATVMTSNAKVPSHMEAAQRYIKTLKDEILAFKANIKLAWQGQ